MAQARAEGAAADPAAARPVGRLQRRPDLQDRGERAPPRGGAGEYARRGIGGYRRRIGATSSPGPRELGVQGARVALRGYLPQRPLAGQGHRITRIAIAPADNIRSAARKVPRLLGDSPARDAEKEVEHSPYHAVSRRRTSASLLDPWSAAAAKPDA